MTVSSKKLICLAVTGSIMLSIGIISIPLSKFFVVTIMEQEEVLVPGSLAYDIWKDIPIPIHMQFWIWNLTNPEEFLAGGPARLSEIGPYSYREYRPKFNITHHPNGTVSYRQWKTFFFESELSIGPESEVFYTVNAPVFTVANLLINTPDLVQNAWKLIHELSEAEVVLKLTVGDLLNGYSDKYLELAQNILGDELIPSTTFGVLPIFNASDDGLWSVYTGETGLKDLNKMDMWNQEKLLPYWTTDYANALNGTDGTIFHPFISADEDLYVFSTYICRSGGVVYDGTRKYKGIPLYHYAVHTSLFADPSINPTNIDFCTPDQSTCPPSGLINATECYFKAPVYASMPHFLYGDESLFESVIGMHPDKDMHELSTDVDTLSGVSFIGNLRAQLNLKVGPYDYITGAENVREMYLPLVWLNESATLPDDYVQTYHNYIQIPQYVIFALVVFLISVGGGIVIGLVNLLVWRWWRARKEGNSEEEKIEVKADMSLESGVNQDSYDNEAMIAEESSKESGDAKPAMTIQV